MNPHEHLAASELKEKFQRAVADLPLIESLCFVATRFQGRSPVDVAWQMGVSVDYVERRANLGARSLADTLGLSL